MLGLLSGSDRPGGDALDELVPVVDVVDEDADAAVLGLVSGAGNRDIQEAARLLRRSRNRERDRPGNGNAQRERTRVGP